MVFAKKEDARWVVPVAHDWHEQEMCDVLDFDEQLMLMKDAGAITRKLGSLQPAPEKLYAIGDIKPLTKPAVAIVGPRKATPYGLACARRFAKIAVEAGYVVLSGGALGADAEAHRAAIEAGGLTVAVLAGGLDDPYPRQNHGLFRDMLEHGGTLVSEQAWDAPSMPYMFLKRNELIAALADAVLVVEAGLPSGTFSLCDGELAMGKPVLAVPGAITSPQSKGANALIAAGAIPVWDDAAFLDALRGAPGVSHAETTRPTLEVACVDESMPVDLFQRRG